MTLFYKLEVVPFFKTIDCYLIKILPQICDDYAVNSAPRGVQWTVRTTP